MPKKVKEKTIKMKKEKEPTLQEKLFRSCCFDHTGKMEGMVSVSTCCLENPLCKKNQAIEGSICSHCYAKTMQEMYKDLYAKDVENINLWTKEIIDEKDLPEVNARWFRFESFGDIFNEIHLTNYMNFAKKNPKTRFTLFTKNYGVALAYFKEHKCPENVNIMISSLFLNKRINLEPFYETGAFESGQCKVFTVFDYNFLKEHPEVNINCGSRSCLGCRRCYEKNSTIEVNEILKSDQNKTESMLLIRDSSKLDSLFAKLGI